MWAGTHLECHTAMLLLMLAFAATASAPPLSPEEALRVLLASRSELNRTGVPTIVGSADPVSITVRSGPSHGPFGELRSTPMPVSCCNVYVHSRAISLRATRVVRR